MQRIFNALKSAYYQVYCLQIHHAMSEHANTSVSRDAACSVTLNLRKALLNPPR